jgi:hypothetical protein
VQEITQEGHWELPLIPDPGSELHIRRADVRGSDTYDAHQQREGGQGSTIVPSHLTPEQLGLPGDLSASVKAAMQESGEDSFWEFLRDALERKSKTQLGLARVKKERETQLADFKSVPTSDLLKTRRLPEAYERIRRAIATIIEHNRRCADPNQCWYITQTLLRDLTGAHPRFIRPVLDANADLIERHHQSLGILSARNRTKPIPITHMLCIAETVAELPSLSEIALPPLDASSPLEQG